MEENKYENIIARYTEQQLVYERVILLKQFNTIKKQLALLDDPYILDLLREHKSEEVSRYFTEVHWTPNAVNEETFV